MADQIICNLLTRLKDVNNILNICSGDTMPFEQADVIARFYYDYQDTNVLIDEAERLATEDAARLRGLAVSIKDETATLLNNIGKLDGVDFKQIANEHSKKYYSIFQEVSMCTHSGSLHHTRRSCMAVHILDHGDICQYKNTVGRSYRPNSAVLRSPDYFYNRNHIFLKKIQVVKN